MNFHKGGLTHSLTQLMSDEVVCRTAPATPGLLNRKRVTFFQKFEHKLFPH